MFTGIVVEMGRVVRAGGGRLLVEHGGSAAGAGVGASIAVNGACLTVVDVDGRTLQFDVVPETLSRTNLGDLRAGDAVNLEPPLRLDQGLDGHLVQGHVDGVGVVVAEVATGLGRELTVEAPAALARYIAEKGSIAVDGTSLTIAGVQEHPGGAFTVALIPHTLASTIAHTYRVGSRVNLEVDLLARYVERLLGVK